MELKKVPKSTHLVVGHNSYGEFSLWYDISFNLKVFPVVFASLYVLLTSDFAHISSEAPNTPVLLKDCCVFLGPS